MNSSVPCLVSASSRLSSISNLATVAVASSSANSRTKALRRLSISAAWLSRDNSRSWSDCFEAESKKSSGTGLGISRSFPLCARLWCGMGYTRKGVTAKLDLETVQWIERERVANWPFLSLSGLINLYLGYLRHLHGSGVVTLEPGRMHERLCLHCTPTSAASRDESTIGNLAPPHHPMPGPLPRQERRASRVRRRSWQQIEE